MLPTSRWRATGLAIGISVALAVWILRQAGWLEAWDGVFYDRIHSWTTHWRVPESKVLVVRLAREDSWSDADAIKTLEVLEGLGAKAVLVDFVPYRNSREFFQRAAELKNVIFGRALRPNPDNPDTLRLDAWPAASSGLDLPWGVTFLPPSIRGVHRWQYAQVMVGSNVFPTLESKAAAAADPESTKPAAADSFLISFAGGPGTVPNVSVSRVLTGELVAEMVKGKVVLIGMDDEFLGLETPVSGGLESMTFLEFQGNALQTLLDGTPLRPLPSGYLLLLLVSLGIVSCLLYQRVSSLTGARVALGLFVITALASMGTMQFFRFWLPLGTLVLAQIGQFALTLMFKTRRSNLTLNELRLRALSQIRERFCPQNVLLSADYWDHLASMINQTLDVERMLFFERVPQTQQLRAIKAFNCLFEEMREKDRTLEASTFATALAKGKPVRVSGLFERLDAQQIEYVCPLIFAGEVFGVWVIAIDPAKAATIPEFDSVLLNFSQQIARTLYHKKHASPKRSAGGRLKAWFSSEKEDQMHGELSSTADLLEQYYDVLDTVFSQIGTATIVYDFFGRVLKVNEPALVMLQPENFSPTRATAMDFLRLVTGKDESQARHLLRNVLLEHSPASLPVKLTSQGDRQFLLRLFPLSEHKQALPGPEPARVGGIVCELLETTSLSTLASLKGVVADRLGVELRNHLAAIQISATLLEGDTLPPAQRQKLLDAVHYKTKMCVHVLSECLKYLGQEVESGDMRSFPVDALEVLNQVCAEFSQKAAQRRITFKVQQPQLMAQVLASSTGLTRLFATTIELLLKDAAENTALTIHVEDAANTASFRFSNSGFGIPNERLQIILTSSEDSGSPEFQVFREASLWVRKWGGNLEISSDVGKGYTITFWLRQFPSIPVFDSTARTR